MTENADLVEGPGPPYNLLTERWIPIITTDGEEQSVGLVELFHRAPQIAGILGELPTVSVAIESLVQAIYRRVTSGQYGRDPVSSVAAARQNWGNWEPVAEAAERYLEEHRDRFDLLHPSKPFYQVADLRTAKDDVSGLEVLLADVPNGKPFLTMRRAAGLENLTFAEAARWVVHAQAYDPSGIRTGVVGDNRVQGGRNYPIGPGWAALLGVISPRKGNLAHDLILAAAPSGIGGLSYEVAEDLPVWERAVHTERPEGVPDAVWDRNVPKEIREVRRRPTGPVDALTWQARRMRLVREGNRIVGVVLTQGDPIDPQNTFVFEPRTAWRYSAPQTRTFKETVYMPRELRPGSALWRGVESVFPVSIALETTPKKDSVAKFRGPATSAWMAALQNPNQGGSKELLGNVQLEAVGVVLGSNRSVVDDLIVSELVLPAWLLEDAAEGSRVTVSGWVQLAEQVASAVGRFAANLYGAAGAHDTDPVRDEERGTYLAAAEQLFKTAITGLVQGDDSADGELTRSFASGLRSLANERKNNLMGQVSTAALTGCNYGGTYMTAGKAERFLMAGLNKLLGQQMRVVPAAGGAGYTEREMSDHVSGEASG